MPGHLSGFISVLVIGSVEVAKNEPHRFALFISTLLVFRSVSVQIQMLEA